MAAALDAKGKIVWRKEITPFAFDVAAGTSPVLYRDTVLLQWDQTNKTSRLIALDKKTGEVKWEKKRPDADWAHSTPVLAEVKGKTQLLVASAVAVQGLDPDNGETIWSCGSGDKAAHRRHGVAGPGRRRGLLRQRPRRAGDRRRSDRRKAT